MTDVITATRRMLLALALVGAPLLIWAASLRPAPVITSPFEVAVSENEMWPPFELWEDRGAVEPEALSGLEQVYVPAVPGGSTPARVRIRTLVSANPEGALALARRLAGTLPLTPDGVRIETRPESVRAVLSEANVVVEIEVDGQLTARQQAIALAGHARDRIRFALERSDR